MADMFPGLALRPSWPYVGEVARSLLGVLLAIVLALRWSTEVGAAGAVAAGGAAAIAGATALQDSPHGRLPLVIGVSFGVGGAVLAGCLAALHGVVFAVFVTLWCLGAGAAWAISNNAGLVVAAGTAVLIVSGWLAQSASDAPHVGLLAVLGGLTQAVLVAAWPRQRWKVQRRALTDAYRQMADDTRRMAVDPNAELDPTPLLALREAHLLTERHAGFRPHTYRGMYALPERIAMTLNTLRRDTTATGASEVLLASADVLGAFGDRSKAARGDAQRALGRLDAAVAPLPSSLTPVAQRLRALVAEAAALHFTGSAPTGWVDDLRQPGILRAIGNAGAAVRQQLSGNSPILRHSIRLAAGVGIGALGALVTGVGEGYWIGLTVLMVLRPETAHTYTRCISKVIGTAGGVTLASAVTVFWHPTGVLAAVLAVAMLAIAYGCSGIGYIGYVPLSGAIAAAIVFLVDIDGGDDPAVMSRRILAVILGGALAVGSHVVLPDRSLVRLRQRAGELLKTEIDYASTVIRAFVHPLDHADDRLTTVWDRAIRARSAFEATSGSVRADAPAIRKWLTGYRAALNAVTGACVALEEQVPAARPATLDPRFVAAVDDYVDALQCEPPTASQPWHVDDRRLREADQQLREAGGLLGRQHAPQRMLLTETETITRSLLGLG